MTRCNKGKLRWVRLPAASSYCCTALTRWNSPDYAALTSAMAAFHVALSDHQIHLLRFSGASSGNGSPHGSQSGNVTDRSDFRAAEPFRGPGKIVRIDARGERFIPEMYLKNVPAIFCIGDGDLYNLIESPGPDHGWIQHVYPVRGSENEDSFQFIDAVKFRQELAEHPFADVESLDPALLTGTSASISSKKTMQGAACLALRTFPHSVFGFSDVLGEKGGPLDREEVDLGFVGHCLGQERFPTSRRPREQYPFGWFDPGPTEHLGILKRPFHRLDEPALYICETSYIVPAYIGHLHEYFANGGRLDLA